MYRNYSKGHRYRLIRQTKSRILNNSSSVPLVKSTNFSQQSVPRSPSPAITEKIQNTRDISSINLDNFNSPLQFHGNHITDSATFIKDEIRQWALEFNINQNALSNLLKRLNQHKCFVNVLPQDARTLLGTPRVINIKNINPGNYIHFGLKDNIKKILMQLDPIRVIVTLNINVDGLPLTKSTNAQLWPILANLHEIKNSHFIVGIYHGCSKPLSPNEYLKEFVEEAKFILKNGIEIKNRQCRVEIRAFICDAPAKAYITMTKGHNAHFGCGKCEQEGKYYNNRVIFLDTNATLRSDANFLNQVQEEHHKGVSILTELGIGLITSFPLDYMHLVCLGVMKKMIKLWMRGSLKFRWHSKKIETVSLKLENLKKFIPKEFCRKPRTLKEVDRWKATEFRQFLLYTGPIVLKDVLPQHYYDHFICLHSAISILASISLRKYRKFAKALLIYFVELFGSLYGKEQVSYNVHNLIHLPDSVDTFGNIDSFSAFPFESYMQTIKKMVRKSEKPLQQIGNRVHELTSRIVDRHNDQELPVMQYPIVHHNNILTNTHKMLITKEYIVIANSVANQCVRVQGGVYIFTELIGYHENSLVIVGKVFEKVNNFYTHPIESKLLGIVLLENLSQTTGIWHVTDISEKMFTISINKGTYAAFPLLHQITC
uniref:DUF4806 domain-containing protein n=1 Tax=Photinus pyralis TaxID=7054 RepID=A0A1Y1K7P0_PHOPY